MSKNNSNLDINSYKKEFDSSEIKIDQILERLGNKVSLLIKVIDLTFKNLDTEIEALKKSIDEKQYDRIVFNSHKIKGYISTFGVETTVCKLYKTIEFYVDENRENSNLAIVEQMSVLANEHCKGLREFLEKLDFTKK